MPQVCLVMMVRDEEAIVGRALDSALPLVDRALVVDTGSVDLTVQVVQRRLASFPGAMVHRPWRGFGPSRTDALACALGVLGQGDWCLMLDADQTLEGRLELPDADAGELQVIEGGTYWRLPRLTRVGRPWRYVGATHEFLEVEGARVEPVDSLRIRHHADGSSRANKLERDRQLLLEAVQADPSDARSTFYLAQTYRDLGASAAAAVWYERRAHMGGWEEERWYAQLQAALLAESEEGLEAAARDRSWRPEPLYHLAVMARERGHYPRALLWSSAGTRCRPAEDRLFVERWMVDWALPFEEAVAMACMGQADRARGRLNALLAAGRMPEQWAEAARANLETLASSPAPVA